MFAFRHHKNPVVTRLSVKCQQNVKKCLKISIFKNIIIKTMSEEIEIDEQCRTCLAQVPEMVSLAADHVVCLKVMSVLNLLKTCTSAEIELNDGYPQFVCLACIRKVETSFEFRQQCVDVDKILRSQVNKEMNTQTLELKVENVDDDESDIYEEYEALDDEIIENNDSIEQEHMEEEYIDQNYSNEEMESVNLEILQTNDDEIKCEEIEIIEAYSCATCNLIFPTQIALQKHGNSAHPPVFFQCPKCPVRFITHELLERHVTKHSSINNENKKSRKYTKQKKKAIDFECTECGKKFSSMPALRLHSRKHLQTEKIKEEIVDSFIYEDCGEQFTSEQNSKLHKDQVNGTTPENSTNHCKICYKIFPTPESLQKHETTHNKQKKDEHEASLHKMVYKCKTCSHEVKILTEIKDHLTQTHQIEKQNIFKNLLYACSECQKDFATIYEYFDHTNERTAMIISTNATTLMRKKPYICNIADCGKAFPSPSALKNHSRSHETHWPKKCKYCDTVVNKLPEYIRHLNEKHETLKKFSCKTCGKKFFSERNLKTHVGIHSGERNYMCDYCGFSFHAHNNLVSHRRIHEGVKPYKCTYCPTAFSQYAGLRSHLLNHTQEKKYECPICNRKFLRHSAMKNHIKTHTGQKDYMCHVCGARFGASSSRKKHLLTHTGERNHVCDFCGKAFGRKSNLTVHRKIHTGETPHVCDICGKGFIQKHVLRSHMDTHKKHGTHIISKRNTNRKKQLSIEKLDDESEQLGVIIEFPE